MDVVRATIKLPYTLPCSALKLGYSTAAESWRMMSSTQQETKIPVLPEAAVPQTCANTKPALLAEHTQSTSTQQQACYRATYVTRAVYRAAAYSSSRLRLGGFAVRNNPRRDHTMKAFKRRCRSVQKVSAPLASRRQQQQQQQQQQSQVNNPKAAGSALEIQIFARKLQALLKLLQQGMPRQVSRMFWKQVAYGQGDGLHRIINCRSAPFCEDYWKLPDHGMYVRTDRRDDVAETIQVCGLDAVEVVIVTDASRVLSKLGNDDSLGLSTGALEKYCRQVVFIRADAAHILPILLDIGGTHTQGPFFWGMTTLRLQGDALTEARQHLTQLVRNMWPSCIVKFEDFGPLPPSPPPGLPIPSGSTEQQNGTFPAEDVNGGAAPALSRSAKPSAGRPSRFSLADLLSGGSNCLSDRSKAFLLDKEGLLPETLEGFDGNLINSVCSTVITPEQGEAVQWSDIAGQQQAKQLIQEMVVWPSLYPDFFQGARSARSGMLLFGPPGTGKTMLGKAIAFKLKAVFFYIHASSIANKWMDEAEKSVRILFQVARHMQPSVIFLDEADSLLSERCEGDDEVTRHVKTQFMVEMDGCLSRASNARVLVVAAANCPQRVDKEIRRRLQKRIYVRLPCADARLHMLQTALGESSRVMCDMSPAEMAKVADNTEGFSGADMSYIISDACQRCVREAIRQATQTGAHPGPPRPVTFTDFKVVLHAFEPSVEPSELLSFEAYDKKHGSHVGLHTTHTGDEDDDRWVVCTEDQANVVSQ